MIIGNFLYWYSNTFTTQKEEVYLNMNNVLYNLKILQHENHVIKDSIDNLKNNI